MKKISYMILVIFLVLVMHGCQKVSGEEQLSICLDGGCSEKEQDKAIISYFNDLEDDQFRNYQIEDYDFDVYMYDAYGTGELIQLYLRYQLELYDYDHAFTDLDVLYEKYLDAKEDIFKFDQRENIELRTMFNFNYQRVEFDVIFTKIGSDDSESLFIYMTRFDENIDDIMSGISDYLPLIFSYHQYMEVHFGLNTDYTQISLRTTFKKEELTLTMDEVYGVHDVSEFKTMIRTYIYDALSEDYVIVDQT